MTATGICNKQASTRVATSAGGMGTDATVTTPLTPIAPPLDYVGQADLTLYFKIANNSS